MDYAAEAFDQMQRLWDVKGFNDHQLRCVLRFGQRLDAETLKQAVLASIRTFPILGTRYVGGVKPHWTSLASGDYCRAFVLARNQIEFEEFLLSKVDEAIGPQVRVCLLNASPVSVAVKMNHMVSDAADFKAYLYLLCSAYNGALPDPRRNSSEPTHDRSVRRVLKRFGQGTRVLSFLLQSGENNHSGGVRFPLSQGGAALPFILTRKLDHEATATFKQYGQANGATLNDVVLTALYRCLFRRLALRPGTALRVPVMVDMRRFLADLGSASSLSNLTSSVSTQLACSPGESFADTLRRVKALMDHRKRANLGLNAFIKLDRAYRFFGSRVANRILMSRMNHPLISMTNMGILDSSRLSFKDQRPQDAFLCGSIKHRPYFQLAVCSYEGQLTLSVNLLGSSTDRESILSLFDEMAAELPEWELSRRAAFQPDRERIPELYPYPASRIAVSLEQPD